MKNFIQPGDTLGLTTPVGDVRSGEGVLTGSIFGVATHDSSEGEQMQVKTTGVFDLPKTAAQAWTEGLNIYWDDTNKECTSTATGNSKIGVATEVAINTATIGRVRLNGISV